ncbi:MAG: DTW domain-containing protein [Proteobacteria bacterium]|nr:DTW domain-containing protein [Pseudomonadota bacterium]
MDPAESCSSCLKPAWLCVCAAITPVRARTRVLILQHPQEPDKALGSARLAHLGLPGSTLRVGLSWPNLAAALGEPGQAQDNKQWLVLHLGSARPAPNAGPLQLVDRKGAPLPTDARAAPPKGLLVLDGSWSQAKTMWWRNAWLLKLQRGVLRPPRPSLYREARKEPRREGLSTLEAIGLTLAELEHDPALLEALLGPFRELLRRYRQGRAEAAPTLCA